MTETTGYEKPEVRDLGNLVEATSAIGLFGTEDGQAKLEILHHNGSLPLAP